MVYLTIDAKLDRASWVIANAMERLRLCGVMVPDTHRVLMDCKRAMKLVDDARIALRDAAKAETQPSANSGPWNRRDVKHR